MKSMHQRLINCIRKFISCDDDVEIILLFSIPGYVLEGQMWSTLEPVVAELGHFFSSQFLLLFPFLFVKMKKKRKIMSEEDHIINWTV